MGSTTVGQVMTASVVAVQPGSGFTRIVVVLVEYGVSAGPGVDADLRVLGVVAEAVLLHKGVFLGNDVHAKLLDRPERRAAKAKATGDTAAALMTAPVIIAWAGMSIAEAARFMDRVRVKRLPEDDADGRLVGIVSRRDLLRPYLRPDDDIRGEVAAEALERTLWAEPGTIRVAV